MWSVVDFVGTLGPRGHRYDVQPVQQASYLGFFRLRCRLRRARQPSTPQRGEGRSRSPQANDLSLILLTHRACGAASNSADRATSFRHVSSRCRCAGRGARVADATADLSRTATCGLLRAMLCFDQPAAFRPCWLCGLTLFPFVSLATRSQCVRLVRPIAAQPSVASMPPAHRDFVSTESGGNLHGRCPVLYLGFDVAPAESLATLGQNRAARSFGRCRRRQACCYQGSS